MKFQKSLFLIFITIGLYACSTVKISYNWADYLFYRKIDSYFDIEDQEKFVETKLDKLHIWHRKEELPKYIIFLKEVKHRIKDGVVNEDLDWIHKGLRGFGRNLVTHITKDSVTFLASLSKEQIVYFEEKLSERNSKKLKRIQRPEKEKRAELLEEALEDVKEWIGDLSKEQINQVEAMIVVNKKKEMIKYNHKKNSQQRFIKFLKDRQNFTRFSERLNDWFFNYRRFYTKEYAAAVIERRKRTRSLIMAVDRFATKNQRANAIKKIDYYIKQIMELIDLE